MNDNKMKDQHVSLLWPLKTPWAWAHKVTSPRRFWLILCLLIVNGLIIEALFVSLYLRTPQESWVLLWGGLFLIAFAAIEQPVFFLLAIRKLVRSRPGGPSNKEHN